MIVKQIEAGAMIAKIYEEGEATVGVSKTTIALTPEELRALYAFLKSYYDEQHRAKEEQRKQEKHG